MAWVAVAVGVGTGAVLGAVAGSAKGGDAVWKGALSGAVAGGITAGVGTWAAPALGPIASGALAGGLGGISGGVLNTALSGGNSSDYLRSGLFGGLGGAAMGAAAGGLGAFGNQAAVPGEATGAVGAPGAEAGAPALGDAASGQIGAPASSLSAEAPVPTSSQGIDIGATPTQQYAAAPTTSMTDIGGSSSVPYQMPGGYTAPEGSLSQTAFGPQGADAWSKSISQYGGGAADSIPSFGSGSSSGLTPSDTTTPWTSGGKALDAAYGLDVSPTGPENINIGDSSGHTPMPGTNTKYEPGFLDKFSGMFTGKGTGKSMDFGDYVKAAGMSTLLKGGLNTVGALATRGETQQNRNQLMDLYNQQMAQTQAQANAANQYQGQLQQTYTNPQAYLSSPEAQATRSAALNDIMRKNAQAGRRSVGLAAQNPLLQTQLANLAAYRQGLRSSIQYPTSYGTAAQIAGMGQAYSPTADIFGGLSSAVTPASLAYLYR